ncbi:hypothetical protein [Streptomyces hainanensis]|uniref:Uncharacterized protein n=1 Tax=Streptomyces hainanensis TaxID=402648 RepID=A0A4R4T0R8_9ACTN|nr:hypothetical protein [Streptomyces hainanensis]TDC67963.1 hypothetical protein E1283_28075 [Streptomyces hainanensis]
MTDDPRVATGQGDLHVGDGALDGFAGRLDEIEVSLRDGGITTSTVARLSLDHASFGAGMASLSDLPTRYEAVRARLEGFVRMRQEAMEALGIVTLLSERGYEGVELEQRQRLQAIMAGWEERYAADRPDENPGQR